MILSVICEQSSWLLIYFSEKSSLDWKTMCLCMCVKVKEREREREEKRERKWGVWDFWRTLKLLFEDANQRSNQSILNYKYLKCGCRI